MVTSRNIVHGRFGLPARARASSRDAGVALLVAFATALVLSEGVTAWFAHALHYHHALGPPITEAGQVPLYAPWAWLVWRRAVLAHYPGSALVQTVDAAGTAVLAIALSVAAVTWRRRRAFADNRVDEVHGSARYANHEDAKASGLLDNPRGLVLARWYDEVTRRWHDLRHAGAPHGLVSGPPRMGKDIGNLVPSLLSNEDRSVVVVDPKGDAWKLTAGYRASLGHHVLRCELGGSPDATAQTNLLAFIRFGSFREVADAQLVAASWLSGDGLSFTGNNAIFAKAARPLLAACMLHVLYREHLLGRAKASLRHVKDVFLNAQVPFDELVAEWLTFAHDPDGTQGWQYADGSVSHTHPMIGSVAAIYLGMRDAKLKENILFGIRAALELLHDENLVENLGGDDFRVEDLVAGPVPTALYLVYPPRERERLAPILRIILDQLFSRLTEEGMDVRDGKPARPHDYKLDVHLNEFALLGKLDIIEAALPNCPSFGIRAILYVQDPQQLKHYYGDKETLSAQCDVHVYYPPNLFATAKYLSDRLGHGTETVRTPARGKRQAGDESDREVGRALLTPDEILAMPGPVKVEDDNGDERIVKPGDVLVFRRGSRPFYCQQVLWWRDPELARRAMLPRPPLCPDSCRKARARALPRHGGLAAKAREPAKALEEDAGQEEPQTPEAMRDALMKL